LPSSKPVSHARITAPDGTLIHARTAGAIVRAAATFDAAVTLSANGRTASATSILEILTLGIRGGTELTLSASGAEAATAISRLASLIGELDPV
jgi:phosphocarrier protein HPr